MSESVQPTEAANDEQPAGERTGAPTTPADPRWVRYLRATHEPTLAVIFIAPLILAFELVRWWRQDLAPPDLVAERLVQATLAVLGPVGVLAPGVAFLTALVAWPWWAGGWRPARVRPGVLAAMIVESAVLATPLLVLAGLSGTAGAAGGSLVYAIGGGVYEELAFRWALVGGGAWLVGHLLEAPRTQRVAALGVVSALAFSLCHLYPVGGEPFTATGLLFRSVAGGYLVLVYVGRGIPLAVGAHVAYNVIGSLAGA